METLGKLFLAIIMAIINATLGAYTIACLWGWFIVEKFSAPTLGMLEAYGIMILLGVIKLSYSDIVASLEDRTFGENITIGMATMFVYAYALGLGKFVTLFM